MSAKSFLDNLSLDDFFENIFQSFFKWRVESHSDDVLRNQADVIVCLSFGLRENDPGKSNRAMAHILEDLYKRYRLPVVAQWEVADNAMIPQEAFLHVVREPRPNDQPPGLLSKIISLIFTSKNNNSANYLDTRECLAQAAQICLSRGLRNAIIIAHHDHAWRVMKVAKKAGFEVLVPYAQTNVYDERSSQKYTRTKWRFLPREVLARIFYILKGWM